MIKLSVSYNSKVIKSYELDDQVISIGRLPENKICISNMGISRRHSRIERDANNNPVLSDLNSLNGTFVNNKKVSKTLLSPGDVITIGKYAIVFESDDARRAEAPSALGNQPAEPQRPAAPEASGPSQGPLFASADHSDAEPVLSSVLIETNKHVVYKIDKQLVTLGASENDDIFVSGFMVGEGHIEIEKNDGELFIRSQKFMGKFKVNGKKKKGHVLRHKDRIEIGTSVFRYMENG